MAVFSDTVFAATVFDADVAPVVVQQNQGLLFRAMKPVPYRGPSTGARVISPAAIRRARRKFRQREEDLFLLGVA